MNKEQEAVLEFHRVFDCYISRVPKFPPIKTGALRLKLIEEELEELKMAYAFHDIVKVADALGDLLYVVYGAGISFGIDLEPIFNEIHRSNMTKVGGTKRKDGKLIKPDTYDPPKLKEKLGA